MVDKANIYDLYLTNDAKTNPKTTIFEHSSDVLQVIDYLIEQNRSVKYTDLIRTGALVHDIGKIEKDFHNTQWIHSPHSAKYLEPLLDDARFKSLSYTANINLDNIDRELLLEICETHHNPSPNLLRRCKDAILVTIADTLASSIEVGTLGNIASILHISPYLCVNLELVRSLGFDKGFDAEIHRIDLPGQFVEDLFFASMIFHTLDNRLKAAEIYPLLQKGASLWVVGELESINKVLLDFIVDPKLLYDSLFDSRIYDTILDEILTAAPAGSMQIDSMKYILVNEAIAQTLATKLYTRRSMRTLLERYNLSYLADNVEDVFSDGIVTGVDTLWQAVRLKLMEVAPELKLPESVTHEIQNIAEWRVGRANISLIKPNESFLNDLKKKDKKLAGDLETFLKLFDASGNYYRSVTNIILELFKMRADIERGTYSLSLADIALLDGKPLIANKYIKNKELCPICRRFSQELAAQAMITGNPKTDSQFQIFRSTRGQIRVCRWCFLVGYLDLPIAKIKKDGQSISKEREYLLVTSPLSREKLQWLVNYAKGKRSEGEGDTSPNLEEEGLSKELELLKLIGVSESYDELAILGMSRQNLSHLRGFVLPMVNVLSNLVCIRIPAEELAGEDRVSGAVHSELVKATMYEFHRVTGATSMHYNVIAHTLFSVNGKEIQPKEMERAEIAYKLMTKDNFGRHFVHHTWVIDSGLFMLLLSNPRKAVNLIFHKLRREKRAPGEQKIKEVMNMAERLAQKDNWKFNLGLKITNVLVDVDLLPSARSFWKNQQEQFSGVELTKWLQRIKMAQDETSTRAWGNRLINALKRGDVASRDFRQEKGIDIQPPGEEKIKKILELVDEIISTCNKYNCKISEFSRDIADMDYYLLFYHNQKIKEAKQ